MVVKQEKWYELKACMELLGIKEEELIEKFITGSGSGGQRLHKTSSCVYLKHLPSGIEVKCQKGRSREDNRFFARRLLCEKFKEHVLGMKTLKQTAQEKIRRRKKNKERRRRKKEDKT